MFIYLVLPNVLISLDKYNSLIKVWFELFSVWTNMLPHVDEQKLYNNSNLDIYKPNQKCILDNLTYYY